MFDGEASKQLFYLIAENPVITTPVLDLPQSTTRNCCSDFRLNILADLSTTDNFKNDRNGFLYRFKDVISSAVITLEKGGEDIATLSDDTYGTFKELGFYVNEKLENYTGYQLDWRTVLDEFGPGVYIVKCTYTSSLGGDGEILSYSFNLQAYTPDRANGTVKVEYVINNFIGDNSDDKNVLDFGELNWYNAIRIPAYFGFDSSTYDRDYIKYENGQKVFVDDNQELELTLKTKLVPGFIHSLMRTEIMQADVIAITDYNANNPNSYIEKHVKPNSEYAPKWSMGNKLSSVEVKFIQEFNNLRKLRC